MWRGDTDPIARKDMPQPLKVLAKPADSNAGENPYNELLYRNLRLLGVEIDEFTPARLLRGSYDIVHVHWIDHLLLLKPRPVAYARAAGFLTLAQLARIRGAKVVWTAHNISSHERVWPPRLESAFWGRFAKTLDGFIALSRAGIDEVRAAHPGLRRVPAFVVPHGHYRDFYANDPNPGKAVSVPANPRRGTRYLYFGMIRPYKNVPQLIRSFLAGDVGDATLVVAGDAEPSLRDEITSLGMTDERVSLTLERIEDDEVPTLVRACDVVILPYKRVLNSGAAMLALSFDRPVVLPRTQTFLELRDLVGSEWVFLFDSPFDARTFEGIERWLAERENARTVDLRPFEWKHIAEETLAAYRSILSPTATQGS